MSQMPKAQEIIKEVITEIYMLIEALDKIIKTK
jgi:hypothetical protein